MTTTTSCQSLLFTNPNELIDSSLIQRMSGYNPLRFTPEELAYFASYPEDPIATKIAYLAFLRFQHPEREESMYPTKNVLKITVRNMMNRYFQYTILKDKNKKDLTDQVNSFFSPGILQDVENTQNIYEDWLRSRGQQFTDQAVHNLAIPPIPLQFYLNRPQFLSTLKPTLKASRDSLSPTYSAQITSEETGTIDGSIEEHVQTRPRAKTR